MKKTNRFSRVALFAIVLAVMGAFASHEKVAAASVKEVTLYWYAPSGSYVQPNTQTAEITRTGCPIGAFTCEQGFAVGQLKNSAMPSQGPKTGETAQVQLHN